MPVPEIGTAIPANQPVVVVSPSDVTLAPTAQPGTSQWPKVFIGAVVVGIGIGLYLAYRHHNKTQKPNAIGV